MKKGPLILLAGAAGIAIAILAVAWNGAFAAEACAPGEKEATAIEQEWSLGAAEANVNLTITKDLSEDQQAQMVARAEEIAGSQAPWDFDHIWLIITSGGMTNILYFKGECGVGKMSVPTDVFVGGEAA